MAVITISRQKGSFGDEIAKVVAEKLRYNLIAKTQISDALANQGIGPHDFEKFDGKRPSIWRSLSNQKKRFIHFLRAAVYDFAGSGNVVIMGRGGQALLKNIPGTLHVRIVAPFENRVRRIMEMEDGTQKKAEEVLVLSDNDSSGYIRSFFDINWNDANLYDLVLNTRIMSVETAYSLIAGAVSAPEFNKGFKKTATSLEDMALEEKIQGILTGFPGITLTEVVVTQRVALLTGLARSQENIEQCKSAVASIGGVEQVRTKLDIVALTGI